jgi:hypothetical protein
MTKLDEFKIGCNIIQYFCNINNIQAPAIVATENIKHMGFYDFDTPNYIYVNLKKCKKTSKNNHPMMVYENTIIGTMLHEFGHFLHFQLFPKLTDKFKKFNREPLLHYREMDIEEDIAECFRLFILHPQRLHKGRPKRFDLLCKYVHLDSYTMSCNLYDTYKEKNEKLDIKQWELFLV